MNRNGNGKRDILRFIDGYRARYDVSPPIGLIAHALGCSRQRISQLMRPLVVEKYLYGEWTARGWRYSSLRLTAKGRRFMAEDGER